ncbi:glycoside hydrolase family 43 protein [Teratosphaeria destructans]|uniref:Glycoside hydrolase family 43 protein n=1 Tax=Teratosphaeria destructans TaxID=418781 RepID=A0A9W7T192_9PEZI|nr:glycoside hydrolase family 43 protein [Teratosphaeria destructans]
MLLSQLCQLPVGLLAACILGAEAEYARLDGGHVNATNIDVLDGHNFPDPAIVNVGSVSYVFGTSDGVGNAIPMTQNSEFDNAGGWSAVTDAFPQLGPSWGTQYSTWAPDVSQLTDYDGSFAMYYAAALTNNTDIHCVGIARSMNVAGPYTDASTTPLICPYSAGGAIDAAGFLDDDNKRYVVYKIDGPAITNGGYCNSPSNPPSTNTSLMLQQVQNDGSTLNGSPVVLYNNQGVSDSYNVEAPYIVKRHGVYFLFFSSGCTSADSYTVSYLTASSVLGPYSDRQVLLKTGDFGLYGPGGASFSTRGGQLVYHSEFESDNDATRWLNTAHVMFGGNRVSILNASS